MGSKNDQISIQFAINPWLHGEKNDEVVDLKNAKAPALIQPVKDEIAHLSGTESDQVAKAQLWIEDGRLFNFENNEKTPTLIQLSFCS